jgi:hypothetical protein
MVKIYQSHRYNIASKLVAYTFDAREKLLHEREASLALEVYNTVFDEQTRLKMNSLPEGWLDTTTFVYANAGGYSLCLHFNHPCTASKRIPANRRHDRFNLTDQDLIGRVQTLANDAARFAEERNSFRRKIESFLKSVSTDKRLFELMPELKAIIGDNFFGVPVPVSTAIVATAAEILCVVAKNRGEDREGCCEGKLVKEVV